MASIIQFPKTGATPASTKQAADRTSQGMGELLFFTGVRYSRADGGPVHAKPPKGRAVGEARVPRGRKF